MTDNVYCLVKIIQKDERIIAALQFEIKLFDFFSTNLNSSLIIFIRTYTANCQNALDRLRVYMNIILFIKDSTSLTLVEVHSESSAINLRLITVKISVL